MSCDGDGDAEKAFIISPPSLTTAAQPANRSGDGGALHTHHHIKNISIITKSSIEETDSLYLSLTAPP